MGQSRAHLLGSLAALYLAAVAVTQVACSLTDDLEIYGNSKAVTDGDGQQAIAMTLDRWGGSGFRSKVKYLFGRFDVDIKLVPGNSAGTVTTFYLISEGVWQYHDEIDLEFLGNSSGEPYTLHTNMYARGKGGREKRYRLWFDPTAGYHTYTIIWTQQAIEILVDDKLIRRIKNQVGFNAPYPNYQPMRVYGSIWDADDWATQGGRVKTDWSRAPFTAFFRSFKAATCTSSEGSKLCGGQSSAAAAAGGGGGWFGQDQLDPARQEQLKEVDAGNKIYDYCTDYGRYQNGVPPEECGLQS